jgi:hypothetical protein
MMKHFHTASWSVAGNFSGNCIATVQLGPLGIRSPQEQLAEGGPSFPDTLQSPTDCIGKAGTVLSVAEIVKLLIE